MMIMRTRNAELPGSDTYTPIYGEEKRELFERAVRLVFNEQRRTVEFLRVTCGKERTGRVTWREGEKKFLVELRLQSWYRYGGSMFKSMRTRFIKALDKRDEIERLVQLGQAVPLKKQDRMAKVQDSRRLEQQRAQLIAEYDTLAETRKVLDL